jgi:hypothetical protein
MTRQLGLATSSARALSGAERERAGREILRSRLRGSLKSARIPVSDEGAVLETPEEPVQRATQPSVGLVAT